MIHAWPTEGWDRLQVVTDYRMALLRALAVAHFAAQASGPSASDSALEFASF